MRKFILMLKGWMGNKSLSAKIVFVTCIAAFIPVGAVLFMSIKTLQNQYLLQQLYAYEKGYEQVYRGIDDKMTNTHNIAMLLAVSDVFDFENSLSDVEDDISQQLVNLNKINSSSFGMEMAFESCSIEFFIDDKYEIINGVSNRFHALSQIEKESWYQELQDNKGAATWIAYSGKNDEETQIAVARCLWSAKDYSRADGVLVISLKKTAVEDLLVNFDENQIIYLRTDKGQLLAGNKTYEELEKFWKYDSSLLGDEFVQCQIDNAGYYGRCQEISDSGIYLGAFVPKDIMVEENRTTLIRMSALYICICFVMILLLLPIIHSMARRLNRLSHQMEQMDIDGMEKLLDEYTYNDEIGQLIEHYNELVDKVEESLKMQYALGEEKKGAELKALQSQINPHFLYNTLDMINWMAQKGESDNIREVIQAMSRFYRLTLSKGEDIISIGDELKMCEAYMEIQRKRYRGKLQYIQEVEDEVLKYAIPKITLQPFIENAIIHGINEKEDSRGTIRVDGWIEDERITLSVSDDGNGMMPEEAGKSKGSHYGMENIRKRLQIFYQEDIPIQLESTPGIGTCVIINIPLKNKNEGEA